jgi:hypothetical protein
MADKPHPEHADRWADGTVRTGNRAAQTHGVYAFENRGPAALPADLRISVDEFRAQVISDRGGVDNLTAIEAAYIRRLVELETVVRLLTADLAQRGLFTAKGRVRSSISKLFEGFDRWDRYAQRIGLDRCPRQVQTLSERLTAMVPANGTSAAHDEHDPEPDGGSNVESLQEVGGSQAADLGHD